MQNDNRNIRTRSVFWGGGIALCATILLVAFCVTKPFAAPVDTASDVLNTASSIAAQPTAAPTATPTPEVSDALPPLFQVEYGTIEITPAERDVLFADLEAIQQSIDFYEACVEGFGAGVDTVEAEKLLQIVYQGTTYDYYPVAEYSSVAALETAAMEYLSADFVAALLTLAQQGTDTQAPYFIEQDGVLYGRYSQEMVEVQLIPSEMVLVYASAGEATVLVPSVNPFEGDFTQTWYEVNVVQENGRWVMDSWLGENSAKIDVQTVYQHNTIEDVKNQIWQDIIQSWEYPDTQYMADVNGDGEGEIFAFVVSEVEEQVDGMTIADLWCYHDRTYEKIKEVTVCSLSPNSDDAPKWMTVGERELFAVMQTSMTWVWTDVYTVQDGAVVAFEGIGQSITQGDESLGEDAGDFTIVVAAYDSNYILNATGDGLLYTGRTAKPYYLYWDEENCIFREYGAIKINQADLAALGMDAQALEALLQAEGEADTVPLRMDEIYQYANGKYKVNYSYGTDEAAGCYYLALALEDGALVNETLSENSGYYLPAVYPAVAVYPTLAQADLADYFTNAIAEEYGELSGMLSQDAMLTQTDLDHDGCPELWMMVEVYKYSVGYVFELRADGRVDVVGALGYSLPSAMQIGYHTALYSAQESLGDVLYFKHEEGFAVRTGNNITETFFTLQDNQLVCNTLYASVGFEGMADQYQTDDTANAQALTKEEYEAKQQEYLCGASDSSVVNIITVSEYAQEGTLATAIDKLLA